MKVRLFDQDIFRSIDPISLRAYAKAEGWQFVEEYISGERTFGEIFVSSDDAGHEIILPNSSHFADYSAVVGDAIRTISEVEERDELQIVKDIQFSGIDVVRVRAPEGHEFGSIPIESGVDLFRSSHDLLLAAACAVGKKKPVYKAGRTNDAANYMDGVNFGQTEVGSFIVTLLSPVPPALDISPQPALWPEFETEPFERKVTRTLSQAMEKLRAAVLKVNSGHGIEEFEDSVKFGVSANLCAAASKLIDCGGGLDLSLTWARSRITPLPRSKFTFQSEDARVLSEAARLLKGKAPRFNEDLTGFVTKLSRSEAQVPGTITIKAILDDRLTSVTTDLDEEMYAIATAAHTERNTITISGDLVREGQRWKLNNPHDLIVEVENIE